MAQILETASDDFKQQFTAFLAAKRVTAPDVNDTVAAILADVRDTGDTALARYTKQFDRVDLSTKGLAITSDEVDAALAATPADQHAALELAAQRITAFHARQIPADDRFTDAEGIELGHRWTAVGAAGLYVPGGTAAYPSSVLMNAIPARAAGVGRIVMVVPTPDGILNPLVLAAARLAGVSEIYRVGGAQAIGALAYGTATIPPVDVIVGPGNAYVAAAKRQVFGIVGIDMIAGPSEILVIADALNDPAWIAADLLSQAEHDVSAQAILMTDDREFAQAVERAIAGHLETLPRAGIARQSWEAFGAIILLESMDEAPALIDRIAPEHLELALEAPEAMLEQVRNAGAIFLGRHTPEAVGDYIAGPNHVLPTARSARFASGLSVLDFMKRTTLVSCTAASLKTVAPAAITLAKAEGLDAHARSLSIRMNPEDSAGDGAGDKE